MTTLDEGFGKVLFEGMLCGAPIVVSNIDNMPYLVEDSKHGLLVEPGNITAFVESIDKLLNDMDLASQLGINAANFARNVNKPSLTKRIKDLLDELE